MLSWLHRSCFFLLCLLVGFACENDVAVVQRISFEADSPTESTKNLILTYADDGYARVEIHAALAETYRGQKQITKIKDSLKLGDAVLKQIGGFAKLHKPQVEQASFAVLKAPDVPSILIETAFISNPNEEAKLADPQYQNDIADALVKGLQKYFERNPPLA
ncbi:MAG: N-acetylmuramoyl-L-alanine amidase AmiC precursor, partial [Bacteroidota bacterium]